MCGTSDSKQSAVVLTSHSQENIIRMHGLPDFEDRGQLSAIKDARALAAVSWRSHCGWRCSRHSQIVAVAMNIPAFLLSRIWRSTWHVPSVFISIAEQVNKTDWCRLAISKISILLQCDTPQSLLCDLQPGLLHMLFLCNVFTYHSHPYCHSDLLSCSDRSTVMLFLTCCHAIIAISCGSLLAQDASEWQRLCVNAGQCIV